MSEALTVTARVPMNHCSPGLGDHGPVGTFFLEVNICAFSSDLRSWSHGDSCGWQNSETAAKIPAPGACVW